MDDRAVTESLGPLQSALTGRYRVDRRLGEGGMSVVWLAEDLKHRRPVAIKVLRAELTALLGSERFLREIEFTARLAHPHILPLLDSGEAAGQLFYTTPFVAGDSLRSRLAREKQLPLDEALRLTREIADALDYAHRQGVIHRDLKPENILLQEGHAVVADFGIAHAVERAGGERLTRTGAMLGTPTYMSPEQVAGQAEVDGRSDTYSLACVLFEMLAGTPPFVGPTAEALVYQHLSSEPPRLAERRSSVQADVAQAVQRALAKTAADRFASAGAFAAALGAPTATAMPSPPPARAATRRGRAVAIVAVLLTIAGAIVWPWARSGRPPWRPAAPAGEKSWILVADFESADADRATAEAARDLVIAALDQSDSVSCVSAEQTRTALQKAGKPADARLDAATAREIAYRSAVRSVVQGRIGRLGGGYSTLLTAVDVEDGHTILTVSEAARDAKDLIPALGRLARRFRRGLGERAGAVRATRPLVDAATPSFEAYRKYLEGRDLVNGRSPSEAIRVFREALALDPDFAGAWGGLGTAFSNIGMRDSADMAYREALRRPQRLSDSRRLYIEAQQAAARLDWPAAKAALERLLRDNPPLVEASVACNALGNALVRLGRDEEALESYSRGIALAPFGPTQASIINRFSLLMKLGRYEEAQGDAERLTGITHRGAMIDLAVYRRDWGRADTLARAYAEDETADQWSRSNAALSAASASAVRGRVSAAVHWLRRGRTIAQGVGPEPAASMWADEVMLSLMSGRALPSPPALARSSSLGNRFLMWPGWFAASGDSQLAERVVREVRAWLTHHPHDLDPDSLSWSDRGYLGLMAYGRKLWPDAATQLGIVATVDRDPGGGAGRFELAAAWLCADAQEHLGRTDSAAFYLERIVAPRVRYHYMEADVLGLYYSFALRRLVGIYVKLGKVPEARARWDTFSATCTHSDPDLVPAIDETRAALVAAEAMARTSRR